ncbi:MAG: site-2 protease family protein [Clostridiaceae bacterium]|nr:site-2 protease family protein [Clostridiaceae bacterium]
MPLAFLKIVNLFRLETVIAALPVIGIGQFDFVDLLIMLFVMTLSLSFHEFAHAWTAYRLGDDTAALAGRMTLNPLRHLDPIGSLVFLFVGVGWAKPVPVNPSRFTKAKSIKQGMLLTSIAGPIANILLGTISWILFCVIYTIMLATSIGPNVALMLIRLFVTLYSVNMLLAVFNLLPIPPLDGSRVLGAVLPDQLYFKIMQYERYIGIIFLMVVFLAGGALSRLLGFILTPFNYAIQYPITWVFQQLQAALGLPPMPMIIG